MKFVTKANTAISTGADQVVSAVSTASHTLQTELGAGITEAHTAITTVTEQLGAVVTQIKQLSQPFNPQALVGPMALALTHMQSDMTAVVTTLAAIGPQLVTAGQKLAGLASDAQEAASIAASLPDRLATIRPDVSSIASQLVAIAQRAQDVPTRTAALQPRLTQFWDALGSVQQRLTAIPQADIQTVQASVQAEVDSIKAAMQGDISAVRHEVVGTANDIQGAVGVAAKSASMVLEGLQAQVDGVVADVSGVFDSVVRRVDAVVAGVDQELSALMTQVEGYKSRTHEVALAVVAPVVLVEAAITLLATQVEAVGQVIDGILLAVEAQISRLEALIAALKQAIDDAVNGVDTALTGMCEALGELIDEIDDLKETLLALPDRFEPVDAQIDEANQIIKDIQQDILAFMAQADSTLAQASREMDQADERCDNAIAVCSKYITRSFAMVGARILFIGVKAMIPGIRVTIANARVMVKTAGNTAISLLDDAITIVEQLRTVLQRVIEQVRQAVAKVIAVLEQIRTALVQAQENLAQVSVDLHTAADLVKAQPDPLIAEVRTARDNFLAATLPREKVNAVQAQVLGLNGLYVAPIYLHVNRVEARVLQSITDVQAQIQPIMGQFNENTQALRKQMVSLQQQLAQPPAQLMTLMDKLKAQLNVQVDDTRQAIDDVLAQIDTLITQAQQAVESATLQPMQTQAQVLSGLFIQTSSKTGGLLDDAKMSADRATLDVDGLDAQIKKFKSDVEAAMRQTHAEIQGSADQTLALREKFEATGKTASRQPEATSSMRVALLSAALPLQQAVASTRDEVVLKGEQANLASADLRTAMAAAGQRLTTLMKDAMAAVAPPADAAKKEQQKMAEQLALVAAEVDALQAQVQVAHDEMSRQTVAAQFEVEVRRDEGNALIDEAMKKVEVAKVKTEVARVDVVSAEAMVDAEVVKNGGSATSRNAQPAEKPTIAVAPESPVADSEGQGATNVAPAASALGEGKADTAADKARADQKGQAAEGAQAETDKASEKSEAESKDLHAEGASTALSADGASHMSDKAPAKAALNDGVIESPAMMPDGDMKEIPHTTLPVQSGDRKAKVPDLPQEQYGAEDDVIRSSPSTLVSEPLTPSESTLAPERMEELAKGAVKHGTSPAHPADRPNAQSDMAPVHAMPDDEQIRKLPNIRDAESILAVDSLLPVGTQVKKSALDSLKTITQVNSHDEFPATVKPQLDPTALQAITKHKKSFLEEVESVGANLLGP